MCALMCAETSNFLPMRRVNGRWEGLSCFQRCGLFLIVFVPFLIVFLPLLSFFLVLFHFFLMVFLPWLHFFSFFSCEGRTCFYCFRYDERVGPPVFRAYFF